MEQMEENVQTPMAKPALYYGFLTGIAMILLTLIIYFANLSTAKWVAYIGYFILLSGIILGTKAFRDEFRGGFISYGTALGFGTLTIFFASIISGVFSYVFYQFIAPDALTQLKEAAEIRMLEMNPNATDQEIDLALRFVSPGLMTFTSIISYTFVGFVLSLITSAFMKKKDPLEV